MKKESMLIESGTTDINQAFRLLKAQARVMSEATGRKQYNGVLEQLELASAPVTDEQLTAAKDLMNRARNGDYSAVTELAGLRTTQIDLYVRATANFTSFFEVETLKDDERPEFELTYNYETPLRYVGQDGDIEVTRIGKAKRKVLLPLSQLQTKDVQYPLYDLYLGSSVKDSAAGSVDLAFDMANNIDFKAKTLMDSSLYGSFNTGSLKMDKTFLVNSRVKIENLPDTNDLVMEDADDTTQFNFDVIEAIMEYCEKWGNIFNGPVRPTGVIYIPSCDATALVKTIRPTGTTRNAVADAVLKNYSTFEYMGVNWMIIPDVTLLPGVCYPVLNRPIGKIWYKPGLDREFLDKNERENWERRALQKVLGMAIPQAWRPFGVRVTYRTNGVVL